MSEELLPGEILIVRLYRHWVVLLRPLLAIALPACAALVFDAGSGAGLGAKLLATLAAAFGAGAWAILTWLRWNSFRVCLTDQRVILEAGLIGRATRVIALDRIQDIGTRQGPAGRLLGYGTVEIETAGAGGGEVIDHLPDPARFRDQVFVQARARRSPAAVP